MDIPREHVICTHCNGHGRIRRVHGPTLRKLREDAGIKQGEMAERLGISPSYLVDLERGRRSMSDEIAASIIENCTNHRTGE